jgi:hypothetical protein
MAPQPRELPEGHETGGSGQQQPDEHRQMGCPVLGGHGAVEAQEEGKGVRRPGEARYTRTAINRRKRSTSRFTAARARAIRPSFDMRCRVQPTPGPASPDPGAPGPVPARGACSRQTTTIHSPAARTAIESPPAREAIVAPRATA